MSFITLPTNQRITVCGVDELPDRIAACSSPPAVLSIEHPEAQEGKGKAPDLTGRVYAQNVQVYFDITQPLKPLSPTVAMVAQGLSFLRAHPHQDLIVHCQHGMARSTAMVALFMAGIYGDGHENQIIEALLGIRPIAAPNPLMILKSRKLVLAKALVNHPTIFANMETAHQHRLAWLARNPKMVEQHFAGRQLRPLHAHLRKLFSR
ncbi:MAG: hypothetical protein EYC62_08205 [Alphaproteobacteria bacterium]|nr:MAG: hypothetical protein EYC62_08205 [Alphaproteobacteria bacterium]